MKFKQLIVGILGIVAVGCANGFIIRCIEAKDVSRHRQIKLKTIFGINEEMLADTNRFPVSSSRWYEIDLPEDMGFKAVKFSLKDDKSKFGIFNVEMMKKLPPDSDDGDLLKEFRSAVDMVGKFIGVELECPGLMDVGEWRRSDGTKLDFDDNLRLCSDLRIELADGYVIDIGVKDATYVKRNGESKLMQNATVEVCVWRQSADPLPGSLRKFVKKAKPGAIAREVAFGPDLSQRLSEAVNDKAVKRRNVPDRDKIKSMIKKAESGDVGAMNTLASSYRFGHDVKADQNLAFKYSKMAADTGDARGIADLAACYGDGRGTKKDVVRAAELWKKAAELGNVWAMSRYAKCLAEGMGVKQDPKRAAELFAMCASRPHADPWTIVQIASFCLRGFGVEKDEAKARAWLDRLEARAEDGDLSAINILVKFYLDGEKGVGKDAARAYKMAQLAAEAEAVWGYKAMARCYKDGIGVEKNPAKAKEYVEKALKKCKGRSCDKGELQKMLKELDGGR